ncbi:MAG: hypothetical protein ACOVS5_12535, partial [Oligoflexus sp.]
SRQFICSPYAYDAEVGQWFVASPITRCTENYQTARDVLQQNPSFQGCKQEDCGELLFKIHV